MSRPTDEIEQQLSTLLRRTSAIHAGTAEGHRDLERASYGILCLILDEGPRRLGDIAAAYGLDPSTITRQVHAVVAAGLATKRPDPADRRASLLSLTDEGRAAIIATREIHRASLRKILEGWTPAELEELGAGLSRFNTTVGDWLAEGRQTHG